MKTEERGPVALTKPKRPFKPKVRTGCVTCKIRRVKCDEARPSCLRCTSTGRKCDGFSPPQALMFEICTNDRERRSFHYFRERTTGEICSYDASSFWSRLVLQASYSREPVRHALVALGSFHESLESTQSTQRALQAAFTLEQYNKAIGSLTRVSQPLSVEDMLISCIIFVFFENLQGHFDTALKHLGNGLKILAEWRSGRVLKSHTNMTSSLIEDELALIFDNLHVQASVLLPDARRVVDKRCSSYLPVKFETVREAHHYFYQLVNWTCEFLETLPQDESLKEVRDTFIPPQCAANFVRWLAIMERDLHSTSEGVSDGTPTPNRISTVLGIVHLKIQYHIVIIMLRCVPFSHESVFDHQLQHFKSIITLVREFIKLASTPDFDIARASRVAGFDFSILPSLSMIGARCRDPIIRREAISIMQSCHWREDIWDSYDAAFIAEHIMLMEEHGVQVKTCADIPDNKRLHLISCTSFNYSEKRKGLELIPHLRHDPEWIKMTCIRSGCNPVTDGCEEFWVNKRGDASRATAAGFFPQEVDGLFPQIVNPKSQLWKFLSKGSTVRFTGRFHASNIFAARHSRGVSLKGDYVTLSGEFTEYLATDKQHFEH